MTDSAPVAPVADSAPVAPELDAPDGAPDAAEDGKPADDRETRSHRSLSRKADKVRRELADLRSQRDAFEKEKLTIAEERQLAARFRQLSELSKTDRLAAAREIGLDYESMTRDMLDEASLDEPTKAMRREIADLKRQREEQTQRERDAQQREQMREQRAEAIAQVTKVASDAARFPFASDLSERALMRKADSVIEEARKAKIDLSTTTYTDVVEVIEGRQAAKADYWRKKLGMTAAQAAAKVSAEGSPQPNGARKTLSSRDTGDAAKAPVKTMSKEERKRWSMELIPDPTD